MATVTSFLIAELETAVRSGSPQRRARMLQQVTGLFLSEAERLNEQQVSVFDEVLLRLMEQLGAQALAHLSKHICGSSAAPKQVVRQLAYHEDGSVAAPVLAHSDRLSGADLAEIAGTRGRQHLLAIASRRSVDETLADILVRRGDPRVSTALAGNSGARLSDLGYRALVEHAGRDDDLAERLGLRSDLPEMMLQDLLAATTGAVRSRLLNTAPPRLRGRIDEAVRRIDAPTSPPKPPEKIDYTAAEQRVGELSRAGRLNDSAISRFALEGDHTHIIAALAVRSTVPAATIEPLVKSARSYSGIMIACRACMLDWSTAVAIIRSRPDRPLPSKRELDASRPAFETVACSVAMQTLQVWAAQEPDLRGDGPQIPSRAIEGPGQVAGQKKL